MKKLRDPTITLCSKIDYLGHTLMEGQVLAELFIKVVALEDTRVVICISLSNDFIKMV
jgi:hypothetical protein